jgi:glutamate dehydrogenase
VHGRGFDGFHNRFQDIARGGLRVVRTSSATQLTREAERLFDEVYGLSWAQQLKNKDIPEGGAKAAILLEPGATVDRCVKAFVNSILDLIVQVPEVKSRVVDRFGKQELIYLGPDENITPNHIEWIVERARKRGYSMPTAFMSSKPGAGINHKVYGVTSEGVNVFLEIALKARGIDPRSQRFTIKITGGPDGDVAGNMMRILDRDYGANAVIVGVADGSGVGEDPEGLDHAELLRLFAEGLPIASFDRAKLSRNGRVVPVEEPDGAQLRNTMHNRLVTDAFVPGGGRPATIHEGNWQEFIGADGTPSTKVVSEGANLFLTPGAREELCKRGVTIIKDSSANKCGVICSSYEISACMVLSDEEFLSIKDTYVAQVLERLRDLARVEGEFLMRAAKSHPSMSLPRISVELSKVINASAFAIAAGVPGWPADDRELAKQMIRDHLPKVLFDHADDRVWTNLPQSYQNWIVANRLASSIAYREGMEFFDGCSPAEISDLARRYMKSDLANRKIVAQVRASALADREHIADLLERGGARAGI